MDHENMVTLTHQSYGVILHVNERHIQSFMSVHQIIANLRAEITDQLM